MLYNFLVVQVDLLNKRIRSCRTRREKYYHGGDLAGEDLHRWLNAGDVPHSGRGTAGVGRQ